MSNQLPDGSGVLLGSLPLPNDHWLYRPRCTEWDNQRDCSADLPRPILTHSSRDAVVALCGSYGNATQKESVTTPYEVSEHLPTRSASCISGLAPFEFDLPTWRPARHPKQEARAGHRVYTGIPAQTCSYCGSMHPKDVVTALRLGAHLEAAIPKYGYIHKVYVGNMPNPFAGEDICVSYTSDSERTIKKAPERTLMKFYVVHLVDATEEERKIIEKALKCRYHFNERNELVSVSPYLSEK